ncbi:Alpha/Beta hydrolase protein [Paraphoma chrysanthemicola]|uniref:Alpha/Beta hydrolase protein n=1 Tax=Paraphoma chrysanthemicola TaxID=798071 RepID=A0A8K0VSV3_9PLEO|nr:Alpha/Beta hydrolase protein [Paraphoma chrysanthemicola]
MKGALSTLALIAAVAYAQDRCDAPYPNTFCNTTEVLAFQSSDCKAYHIFISRGSDEPYPGRQGNITREICSTLGSKDCGFENIEYPAKSTAWGKDEWCKSAAKGAANGQSQMKAYAQKCPNSKLILLGFSQGGAVAQDILGGGGGQVFECEQASNPALDASTAPGSNIIAAVTFGAVIRSRNQKFTIGDGVNYDGRRARTPAQLAALNRYSDRFRDYCHYGDPMCAVGSEPANVYVHLDYFLEHNAEVISWISEKAKADTGKAQPAQTNGNTNATSSTGAASALTVNVGLAALSAFMAFGLCFAL